MGRARTILGGTALAAVVSVGCTALSADRESCTSDADCRAAFGDQSTCGLDGYCIPKATARCDNTFPESIRDQPEAILLGTMFDRSLDTQAARERATQLAVRHINDEGGLDGRPFGLIECTIGDGGADGLRDAAIEETIGYLIGAGVSVVIGPAASDDVQTAFLSSRGAGMLIISPSATSPTLTSLDPSDPTDDAPGLLWRTAPPDTVQGAAIARDMLTPGLGRSAPAAHVSVIYEEGAYGESLAILFAQEFQRGGGEATLRVYRTREQRIAAIEEVAASEFDEVLFISGQSSEVIAFLDAIAPMSGFDGKGIFLTDAAANADVLTRADARRFSQIRGSRPKLPDPANNFVYSAFLAAYASEFGDSAQPYSFTAHTYDAVWLAVLGAAWADREGDAMNGVGVARGIRRLVSGIPIELRQTSWHPALQQFAAGKGVDVAGASGPLDFDPATEELSAQIETWTIADGRVVPVQTWP